VEKRTDGAEVPKGGAWELVVVGDEQEVALGWHATRESPGLCGDAIRFFRSGLTRFAVTHSLPQPITNASSGLFHWIRAYLAQRFSSRFVYRSLT
jgi:hypothetical protein